MSLVGKWSYLINGYVLNEDNTFENVRQKEDIYIYQNTNLINITNLQNQTYGIGSVVCYGSIFIINIVFNDSSPVGAMNIVLYQGTTYGQFQGYYNSPTQAGLINFMKI
jgi:hypothetical protein